MSVGKGSVPAGPERTLSHPCPRSSPSLVRLPDPPGNQSLCPSYPFFSDFLLLHVSPANSSLPPTVFPPQAHGSLHTAGGLQIHRPSHNPLPLSSFSRYRHGKCPCPQGAVGSTPGHLPRTAVPCGVSPAVRATGAWPRARAAPPLTRTPRNGLKTPASLRSAPVLLLVLLGELGFPHGPGTAVSLVPGTGRWGGLAVAGGRGIFHPSPLLSRSPTVWPTAPEGQWDAGGVRQCRRSLIMGWGLATQEGDLQFKGMSCNAGGGLIMGEDPGMHRGVLCCMGGFCYTGGVLAMGGASWGSRGILLCNAKGGQCGEES